MSDDERTDRNEPPENEDPDSPMTEGETTDADETAPARSDEPTPDRTADAASPGDESTDGGEAADETEGLVSRKQRRYFDYAVLAVLSVLAFVALVQFYLNVSSAIGRWVEPPYRSLFQAAFNLAVLLLAGAGISIQLRRMVSD
jgi:hypothetical protein